jgi:hypothetical protein
MTIFQVGSQVRASEIMKCKANLNIHHVKLCLTGLYVYYCEKEKQINFYLIILRNCLILIGVQFALLKQENECVSSGLIED